jgi:group I intron endonuclease
MELNCGIYIISNTLDNRVYIGSSKHLQRRLYRHKSELKLGKHDNRHLQRFVSKYGLDKIKFNILENCSEERLLELETKYINDYNAVIKGFNMETPRRTIMKESTRLKISKAVINNKNNRTIFILKDNIVVDKGYITYLCNSYKLDKSSVYKILNGTRKKHKGYTFK